jgi:hypothetical protein
VAVGFQQIVVTGAIGLAAGAAVYLYYNKYFDKILGGITSTDTDTDTDTGTTTTPPAVTEFNYFARTKLQCRDENITAAWLQQQGVRVLNFKIFYDNKFYPQACGMPGGRYFLVATAKGDNSSEGILISLGFTKYASSPSASDINPNIPIPGYPPASTPTPTPTPVPSTKATISTNKATYTVGEHVTVTGTGFKPGEIVHMRIKYTDTAGKKYTISGPMDATASATGTLDYSQLIATKTVTGQTYVWTEGATSGKVVLKDIAIVAASNLAYTYSGYIDYPVYIREGGMF